MNKNEIKFLQHLLQDCYMVKGLDPKGREVWRLYDGVKKALPIMTLKRKSQDTGFAFRESKSFTETTLLKENIKGFGRRKLKFIVKTHWKNA